MFQFCNPCPKLDLRLLRPDVSVTPVCYCVEMVGGGCGTIWVRPVSNARMQLMQVVYETFCLVDGLSSKGERETHLEMRAFWALI